MESSARWTERQQESAITPGKPPVLPTPPGGTPASPADAALWISNDDYPEEALENDWQGRVSIGWVIGPHGKVEDCYVVESSGHSVLDEAACRAIKRKGHYEPAHDVNGLAIRATDRRRVIWRLPD
ncbi:energy transducer TonB [Sphingobium nicotianae]|nr:energy transducer TonB [Sphingobium nicotianae]